jgi:NADPH2:quinone reductase
MARAIRIHEHGGPDVLRLEEMTLPRPGAGEVRIRHTAIGLNFVDTYHRSGLYETALPSGLGVEAAGVVEEVGRDVTEFSPGDRVAYDSGPLGAYSTERIFPIARLVALPDAISDEVAAASLLKGMTVEYLVRRTFPVQRGQTVLLHAAAGGVGLIACQWLRAIGATVIGTVSTDEKAALAHDNGCAHPIVTSRESFVPRVLEITGGKGVSVVYDSVGKDTFEGSLACLAPRGMLVGFGNASGTPPPFDPMVLARRGSLFLTRASLAHYTATRDDLLESARALFAMLESRTVVVDVRQRWPLADAADAHRALEGRRTKGSSLLLP